MCAFIKLVLRTKFYIGLMGAFIGGAAYWLPSESPYKVLGINLYLFLALATALSSFLYNYKLNLSARVFSYPMTIGVISLHLLRIGYDLWFEVAKHKYALLEISINGGITIFCAFVGSMLVSFVKEED